jgi:hypothetical protein
MLKFVKKYTCDLTGVTHCVVENELGRQIILFESEIIEMKKKGFIITL